MTANEFFTNLNGGARWDVGVSINRSNKLPLDANSVFPSLAEAQAYVAGTHPTRLSNAYPGQILTVVTEGETKLYVTQMDAAGALTLVNIAGINDIPELIHPEYQMVDISSTLTDEEKKTIAKRYALTKDGTQLTVKIDIPQVPEVVHPEYEVKAIALTEDDVAAGVAQKFALYKDDVQVGDAFTIPEVVHPEYSLKEVTLTDAEKATIAKRFAITKDGVAVTGAPTIDIPVVVHPDYAVKVSDVTDEDKARGVAKKYVLTKTIADETTEDSVVIEIPDVPEVVHPEYSFAEVELDAGVTGVAKRYVITKDGEAVEDAAAIDIPEIVHPEYTIEALDGALGEGVLASYYLAKDGTRVGDTLINIPKDLLVKEGSVVTFATGDTIPEGLTAGTYLKLILQNNEDAPIYIDVTTLIEYVTGEATAEITVSVSEDHKVTATINDGSIAQTKLTAELSKKIDDAHGAIHEHENKEILDTVTTDDLTKARAFTAEYQAMLKTLVDGNFTANDIVKAQILTSNSFTAADITRIRAFTDEYQAILAMLEDSELTAADIAKAQILTEKDFSADDITRIRAFTDTYQGMLKTLVDGNFTANDIAKAQILTANDFTATDITATRTFIETYSAILALLNTKAFGETDIDRLRSYTNDDVYTAYTAALALLKDESFSKDDIDAIRHYQGDPQAFLDAIMATGLNKDDIDRLRDYTLDVEVLRVRNHDGYVQPDGIPSGIDVGEGNTLASKYNTVIGLNNKAGTKGYIFEGTEEDPNYGQNCVYLNSTDGLEIGMTYSVCVSAETTGNKPVYEFNIGTIMGVSEEYITVSNLPTQYTPEYLFILDHPELGTTEISVGSIASGQGNIAGLGGNSSGMNSVAFGEGATANGVNVTATGIGAHAEGDDAHALGDGAHAEGSGTSATGTAAHAEGSGTSATGANAHAEGQNTVAGTAAHAEGTGTNAGDYAHAEGLDTKAINGWGAHAEGSSTTASGTAAHAEGSNVSATGEGAHAEGMGSVASGDATHAEGSSTTAEGEGAHAEGSGASATGIGAHAEGSGTSADGEAAHAEGQGNTATGTGAHAEGSSVSANGVGAHAEGSSVSANGVGAHAEGYDTSASGDGAHAEGYSSSATGEGAHAEGQETEAKGLASHTEGISTSITSEGAGAHAEGCGTSVAEEFGHAEGDHSEVTGKAGHAEGFYSKAQAAASHAEGKETIANAEGAHAEGIGSAVHTGATGAHAEGIGSVATGEGQHVSGKYNDFNDENHSLYATVVGGGTSNDNRKNIYTLDWDGNAVFAGNVRSKNVDKLTGDVQTAQTDIAILDKKVTSIANVINYGGIFDALPDLTSAKLGDVVKNSLNKDVILSEGLLIIHNKGTDDKADDIEYILSVDASGSLIWTSFGTPDYYSQKVLDLARDITAAAANINAVKYSPKITISGVQCITHNSARLISDYEVGKVIYLKPVCSAVRVSFKVTGKNAVGDSSLYTVTVNGSEVTATADGVYISTVELGTADSYPSRKDIEIVATYTANVEYTETVKIATVRDLPVIYGRGVSSVTIDNTSDSYESFKTISEQTVYCYDNSADFFDLVNQYCFVAVPADKTLKKIRTEGMSFEMPVTESIAPVNNTITTVLPSGLEVTVPAYAPYKFYYMPYVVSGDLSLEFTVI